MGNFLTWRRTGNDSSLVETTATTQSPEVRADWMS